jgi:hypothetical protein
MLSTDEGKLFLDSWLMLVVEKRLLRKEVRGRGAAWDSRA